MEYGYFHPDRGYWQTTSEPSQQIIDGYLEEAIEVPLRPQGSFDWDGSQWIEQAPDIPALSAQARDRRDSLLTQSDWTQVADAPVDQTAWATYRQALRDITVQVGFPRTIYWPVAPE